jgi:hypothetical protein
MITQDDLIKRGWTITARKVWVDLQSEDPSKAASLIVRITAPSGRYADIGFTEPMTSDEVVK